MHVEIIISAMLVYHLFIDLLFFVLESTQELTLEHQDDEPISTNNLRLTIDWPSTSNVKPGRCHSIELNQSLFFGLNIRTNGIN